MVLQLVRRQEWGAEEPLWEKRMSLPAFYVFFEYTNRGSCSFKESCKIEVRLLQRYNMKLKSNPDIRYNFVIGGDGSVYEGRGWFTAPRLPKRYENLGNKSLYVAFLGNFKDKPPTDKMFQGRYELVKYGLINNYINRRFLEFTLTMIY